MHSNKLHIVRRYIMRRALNEFEAREIIGALVATDWSAMYEGRILTARQLQKSNKPERLTPTEKHQKAEELRKLPYTEYLKTQYWGARRLFALKRAQYRCQVCNASDKPLNVHHRSYERLGEERNTDIIVLCQPCHEMFHKNGKLATG